MTVFYMVVRPSLSSTHTNGWYRLLFYRSTGAVVPLSILLNHFKVIKSAPKQNGLNLRNHTKDKRCENIPSPTFVGYVFRPALAT